MYFFSTGETDTGTSWLPRSATLKKNPQNSSLGFWVAAVLVLGAEVAPGPIAGVATTTPYPPLLPVIYFKQVQELKDTQKA